MSQIKEEALKYFGLQKVSELNGIKGVKYFTKGSQDDSEWRRETEECVILFVEGHKCYYKNMDVYYSCGGQSGWTAEAEGTWSIGTNDKIKMTMKRINVGSSKYKEGDALIKEFTLKQLKKIADGYTF